MTKSSNQDPSTLLKQAVKELKKTNKQLNQLKKEKHEPIAVIGMGCRLPGGIESPDQLWNALLKGEDLITEMTDERWPADDFYDPNPDTVGKLYTKANGLVSDVDRFDAAFFGITPAEATLMEPQQRLLLETSWDAIENAGIAPDSLMGSNTGVFVGICHMGYSHMQAQYLDLEDISPYNGTGNSHSVASGRLSYLLGLQGPSLSVDTACSSSLVSIHLAIQSLRKGESDLALAAGVNLILEPTTSMIFARAGMLSPDGRCKSFDAGANGYVRGEGAGTVVLKRLSDAIKDGDSISAVIRGSAVNQDGKSQGITAPNELAQEKVLRAALADAKVSSEDVDYVEAHGTGTPLGDPIELAALNTVYGTTRKAPLKVGTVKSNMGHLEAAAGIAGFIKLVLNVKNGLLPQNLHFKQPNPYIDWDNIAIDVVNQTQEWESNRRIGAVSSFGFSGTNCHIILEQAPLESEATDEAANDGIDFSPNCVALSAKTEAALKVYLDRYREVLDTENSGLLAEQRWKDVCFSALTGRTHYRYRAAIRANDTKEMLSKIDALLKDGLAPGVKIGDAGTTPAKIGFMFTGQGAQYFGMGKGLYEAFPVFRSALDDTAKLMAPLLDQPLLSVLWGDNRHLLDQTQYTQPAIFAIQYALSKLWTSLGVQANAVVGHSIGEYAAAVYAGVLTLDDAVQLICARGKLMATLCQPGAMAAVFASEEDTRHAVDMVDAVIDIAAVNGPKNCVISGEKTAVEQAVALLTDMKIRTKVLPVSHAFHSPMMQPMLDSFADEVKNITYKAPRVRFISSKTGKVENKYIRDSQYWVDHVREPVLFNRSADCLSQQHISLCVEIGPGANLVKLAPLSGSSDKAMSYHHSLDPKENEDQHLLSVTQALYTAGASIQWRSLFSGSCYKKVSLPTYPYQKQSFWMDKIRLGNYSNSDADKANKLRYISEWSKQALPVENSESKKYAGVIVLGGRSEWENGLELIIPVKHLNSGSDKSSLQKAIRLLVKAAHKNNEKLALIVAPSASLSVEDSGIIAQDFINLVQVIDQDAEAQQVLTLWCVTEGAYADDQVNLSAYPVIGFAKSLSLELGELWGGIIDLIGVNETTSDYLLKELNSGTTEDVVRYVNEDRTVLRLKQSARNDNDPLNNLSEEGCYLITGGLGGLGLQVAESLVAAGANQLVLVSRTATLDSLPEDAAQKVAEMQDAGAIIQVANVNVANQASVKDLVENISSSDYPLKGIVHAAGVSDVTLVKDLTLEQYNKVSSAKILGGLNLHQATLTIDLDFFVMFSSIASVWGSGGMAHYAAANHFLDGLVAQRKAAGLAANSFNWGPWGQVGMVAGDVAEETEKRGLRLLEPTVATDLIAKFWNAEEPSIIVDADWNHFRKVVEIRREHPMFGSLGVSFNSGGTTIGEKSAFFKSLYPLSVEERSQKIQSYMQSMLQTIIGQTESTPIDPELPLMDLGIDSIMALEIKKQLEAETGETVKATLIFDYPTISKIAQHFAMNLFEEDVQAQASTGSQLQREPIAIVGIGSRLPKAPNGPGDFWNLLKHGESGINDDPKDRWNLETYLDKDPDVPGKSYTFSSGLVDELENFDGKLFGIAPRELESMEPQQRLVLESSWTALEHAGYSPRSMNGSKTGVFVGVGANEYIRSCAGNAREEDIMFIPTGNALNVIAGRVAFTLGLNGPCMAIDTACSSSAVAIHLASQSLQNGECDMALAGGVNAMVAPETFVALSKAHMLSKEGRCKTFDESADGYVRGEGVGVLALKRLSDAERDGDQILAVIKGSAVNQDGRSSSLTAPNGPSQESVIRDALANAGLTHNDVDWVEAHGTATPLGDPIEVQSLESVYCADRTQDNPLILSSVKTNIGHLESAAGVSSVMKAALSLHHEEIPPHLNFNSFNPHISVDASRFDIPTETKAWPRNEKTRRVGVSSFGFSGTNVHLILEEAPAKTLNENIKADQSQVLTLSAKTNDALVGLAQRYSQFLTKDNLNHDQVSFADVTHTANSTRQDFEHRMAVVAPNAKTASEKLKKIAEGMETVGCYQSEVATTDQTQAWLMTGQGSQHHGMSKELYAHNAVFKAAMDACNEEFQKYSDVSLHEVLWGDDSELINNTQYTQPAIFSLEYALSKVLISLGQKPSAMVGHSVGEYAAAVVAGIFDLPSAMKLIAARGKLMVVGCDTGDMAAVLAPKEIVENLVAEQDDVQIAAYNGLENTVVSGTEKGIKSVIEYAKSIGIDARLLTVSHAFHSHMMQPMLDAFKTVAEGIQYQPAQIDIVSTLTGELNKGEMSNAQYWVDHVKRPVSFVDAIATLSKQAPSIYLEVGPGSTLTGLSKPLLAHQNPVFLHCLRAKQDALRNFNQTIAQLYTAGAAINWASEDDAVAHQKVLLPTYAFDRKRYWLGDNASSLQGGVGEGGSAVGEVTNGLLTKIHSPMSDDYFFENSFGVEKPFYLEDHRLYEVVVAPGAFHLANVLLCARDVYGESAVMLDDVVFPAPFILEDGGQRRLHYGFKQVVNQSEDKRSFKIQGLSREEANTGEDWTLHASMDVENCDGASELQVLTKEDISQIQQRASHVLQGDVFYDEMRKIGYQLGPQFSWIKEFWRQPGETLTRLRIQDSAIEQGDYIIAPGLLDSCFQSSALATMHEGFDASQVDSIYIPFALEKFRFFGKPTTELWCHVKIKNPPADKSFEVESYSHTIQVYDDKGRILIDLDTLHSKRAPKEALLRALNKDPFASQYDIHWKPQVAASAKDETVAPIYGTYLVVGDGSELQQEVLQGLKGKPDTTVIGVNCDLGADYQQQDNTFSIDPENTNHWLDVINEAGGLSKISGIVYVAPNLPAIVDPVADQKAQFVPVLNLIKATQQLNTANVPRLWSVTQSAVATLPSDTDLNVTQSSLFGFGKVLDMEHGEFNAVMIDVDGESIPRSAQSILAELLEKGEEKQVAYRRGSRLVARLARTHTVDGMAKPPAPYRLVVEKKGTFDELKFVAFEPRELGSTQIGVKVLSAGLNFRDVMGVLDVYPGEPGPLGGECIGEVIELGSEVTDFAIGDRVMVPLTESCMSTNTATEQLLACRVPDNLGINQASTIPVVYCTALHGLKNIAKLKKGERVLIHAGAGGVGLAAIYIAKQIGAEVFATASEKKRDYLRSIGVEHVYDSRSLDFVDLILQDTDGEGIDVVLNSLAGDFISKSMSLLRKNGRFIEIGKADIWTDDRVKAFRDDVYYEAFDLVMVAFNNPNTLRELMNEIVGHVEAGDYQPLPFTVFNHKNAVEAFRYMAQGKHIGKILINPDSESIAIKSNASYLITGASGGLGMLFANWLAQQGAGEVVLVARRDPRQVESEKVKAIEALGTKVTTVQKDVAEKSDVDSLIATVNEQCLPLAGVLHAAGVLSDAFIVNQDFGQFEKVMKPKLAAAYYLHNATQQLPLDLFVMFSSLSSLMGAPGQANYAAANAFLDGLVHHRRAQGLPGISINWGPWGQVGMAANAQVAANAKASGVHLIDPQNGLDWFQAVLESNPVQRGLMEIDWSALMNMTGQVPTFLSELEVKADSGMDAALQEMAEAFRNDLANAPSDERTTLLIEKICEQIQRVMGLDETDTINPNQPLQELGLDSLMAVELRNILCALIGKQLPATLMFKYPTVASLSGFLIEDMFVEEADATHQADTDAPVEEVVDEQEESEIDEATDDELAAMLEAELMDDDD